MAIVESVKEKGSTGISKRIDPVAMRMLIDGQQSKQYKEPEKSAVREVFSNAVDAISEKKKALSILTGKAKPEDFYIHSEDDVSKDSNFFIGYYNEEFLDKLDDTVKIIHEYKGSGRDILTIKDKGVGIGFERHPDTGKTRLEGVLEIGYSTKRNTDTELGKWGIGAKSPLAIGSNSGYLMETIHNGKKFLIRVFDFNYHSMIGKLNSEGKDNPHVYFYEGTSDEAIVYYEETEEKNGTSIIIETSPSQRNIFKKAVTNQLQYFDNIQFTIIEEDGTIENVPTSAELLYDGQYFSIPKDSDYTKPHLILNKVNYGLINYPSMEVEERKGCLAFKINPSSVEVDRSRESLIWNQKTRESVLSFHEKVEEEALEVFYKSLEKENYAEWIENIMAYYVGRVSVKTNSISSILKEFLEGYEVNMSMRTWGPDKLPSFSLNQKNCQIIRTSDSNDIPTKGRMTATFKEMNIFLQYDNDVSKNSFVGGVPVVIRLEEDRISGFKPTSISAPEKFSILKYLRDQIDHNVKEYIILTIFRSDIVRMTFYESLKTADTLNPNQYYDFEIASNAYKIDIESGESEVKSKSEVNALEAANRRSLQAKEKRENRIMSVIEYELLYRTEKDLQTNATELLNVANGKEIFYGRHFTKGYSYEEDDQVYLRFLHKVLNKDSIDNVMLVSTVKSHLDWFPHNEAVYVRNFFTRIKDRKFQFQDMSSFLILAAYTEELVELEVLLCDSNSDEWANEIFNDWEKLISKFNHYNRAFSSFTHESWYAREQGVNVYLNNLVDWACISFPSFSRQEMKNFIINIAKFGRFAYENSTASEDFLANAYIAIMGMPENTPLDSVPIGVEGFNYSPVKEIRDILSKLDPIVDLLPSLRKIRTSEHIKPILDIALKQRKFKYSSINL